MGARRAILLDLEGTLVDSRRDITTAVNLVRADLGGEPLSMERIIGYVGEGVRELIIRATADIEGVDVEEAVRAMRRHYGAHLLDQSRPYPGTTEALSRLRDDGWALGVVTNKLRALSVKVLEGLGLSGFFEVVIGGDTCDHRKPHPEPLACGLSSLGATVPRSWMVGDSYTDLRAARRLGLKRCYCRFGFGDPADEGWDLAVDSLPELVAYLDDSGFRGQGSGVSRQ